MGRPLRVPGYAEFGSTTLTLVQGCSVLSLGLERRESSYSSSSLMGTMPSS